MPIDTARIRELYQKLAGSPLGMATKWESRLNGSPQAKPLLYGGRRGLLAYGTIGTWDEFELIAAVVNALPDILADLERRQPDADVLRDTIARAVYRYQQGPGTFEQPGTMMGDLVKQISVDEAENIRRAIMGEPPLPQDDGPDGPDDAVVF